MKKKAPTARKSFTLHEDCETYTFHPVSASFVEVAMEGDGEEMSRRLMPVAEARKLYRAMVADGFSKGY